jgi:hypothetical protein
MQLLTEQQWSSAEHAVAQSAFELAYHRETTALIAEVQQSSKSIEDLDEIWRLNDRLNSKRHEIEGKYDYREPALVFVFATLLHDGWLSMDDLVGLDAVKLNKISAIANM